MIRRSERLIAKGYYHLDKDSNSRETDISYHENTVRPYKRRSGSKATSSRDAGTTSQTLASVGQPDKAASVDHRSSTFYSGRMKKACAVLILLSFLFLSVWWFHPFVASFFSLLAPAVPISPPLPNDIPVNSPGKVQPSMETSYIPAEPDPDAVSAAVYTQMERLLVDMQLKQKLLLEEIKQNVQTDIQDINAQLKEVVSDSRLNLKEEVSVLQKLILDSQGEIQSAAASMKLKIEILEDRNVKLSEDLLSIKATPPPVPPPDNSSRPVQRLTPELEQDMKWFNARMQEHEAIRSSQGTDCVHPRADRMPDFALESQGGSVISSRCSETYSRSAFLTFFGFRLLYPSEGPRTVIQGHPMLLPGKCWAFYGGQGTLLISLSHPVSITHVTLDHVPRYNTPTGHIDSAPKDFEVFGMNNENEAGTLLGRFTYDQNGEPTQTFELPSPSDIHHFVKLRVLTNWGQDEYTCLYRFRVHGKMA
ncbi:SUN domain-containing protein 1-like [Gouania willdenowi]|uniref:SUN domain-containing protein 1-like n=1 Tax=Gouania willdenowi TaxID=441366 RepID=A0A8C5H2N0_GOUWI|nr:SUN domain-containing protein 1-like [Gouania willdenowi]